MGESDESKTGNDFSRRSDGPAELAKRQKGTGLTLALLKKKNHGIRTAVFQARINRP